MEEDAQLLKAYVSEQSEEAFRALVERHGPMVHGVARRIAGEEHAEEVTQAVYIILARKASSLGSSVVAGWLYRTARYVALESVRKQKQQRELKEKFLAMQTDSGGNESIWAQIAPLLDEAIHRLRAGDREAIILRFLQGRTFAEVASATGATEAAAKMRVNRALEKLRANLSGAGLTVSAAALASEISAHGASSAAPAAAGLALVNATDSITPNLAEIVLKMLFMKKIKLAAAVFIALVLTIGVGGPAVLPSKAVVTSFFPMDGEWTGTMEISGSGGNATRPVELKVNTSADGRRCDIQMRVAENGDVQSWSFSHEIDPSGKKIATLDDPRMNLLQGFGRVTKSKQNGDEWIAGVRNKTATGATECLWTVRGDSLRISRHDQMGPFYNRINQYSLLELRRKAKASSAL